MSNMLNKTKKMLLLCIVTICVICFTSPGVFGSEDDNYVYSREKEGVWKPSDIVYKTFTIDNIWGEKCYLQGISFKRSYISDVNSGKVYSFDEAKEEGILDTEYNIVIAKGNKNIYSGKISDLADRDINFEEPIFMDINSKVDFNMNISFNSLSGNEYQNKNYEYILYPNAFNVTVEKDNVITKKLTKTGSILNNLTLTLGASILMIMGVIFVKISKISRRGDKV